MTVCTGPSERKPCRATDSVCVGGMGEGEGVCSMLRKSAVHKEGANKLHRAGLA